MALKPGDFPVYSSSVHNNGLFGRYGQFMFDEELITWSVDGGGDFFYRAPHRFSVTNVCGYIRVNPSIIHSRFLSYQLQHLHSRLLFDYTLKAHPSVIRGLYVVPLPSINEQRSIAEALADADAAIESLEHLLSKKRYLKQGAMQDLLTGKRRLPGFVREWKVKRLDELGRWTGGMTPSMRNPDYWLPGTVPWISSGEVKSATLSTTALAISNYAVKQRFATLVPAKSVIVVTRSGILRRYLPVAMNLIPMAINQDIKSLSVNDQFLPEYLLQSLTFNGDRILGRCLKSGTTVESIEFSWFKAFTIPIPDHDEQTTIVEVLSEMDAEISSLEAKLTKARQLKQGMMQELLSGSIRVAR